MRGAEPRRDAHQDGVASLSDLVRSRFACAPTASDRRGAPQRSARSPQGLGHRPSRRRRHHPRRALPSARCAPPEQLIQEAVVVTVPRAPDRRDHRSRRGAVRPRLDPPPRRTRPRRGLGPERRLPRHPTAQPPHRRSSHDPASACASAATIATAVSHHSSAMLASCCPSSGSSMPGGAAAVKSPPDRSRGRSPRSSP